MALVFIAEAETLYTHQAQISLRFTLRVENWKCTEWPQNDLKHLPDKSYPVLTAYSAMGPKFHSVSKKIVKNCKLKIPKPQT